MSFTGKDTAKRLSAARKLCFSIARKLCQGSGPTAIDKMRSSGPQGLTRHG